MDVCFATKPLYTHTHMHTHTHTHTQVPTVVKALYTSPLPNIHEVPTLSESLLTPAEEVERRRGEEERERREFVTPRQPAFTQDQDAVSYSFTHSN